MRLDWIRRDGDAADAHAGGFVDDGRTVGQRSRLMGDTGLSFPVGARPQSFEGSPGAMLRCFRRRRAG